MRPALTLLCCLLVLPAWAEETTVYKRVRPDGTVEFSDQPTPGGQAVEVPQLPTVSTTPPPTSPAPAKSEKPPAALFRYERLQVTDPTQDGTVFFDENGMAVAVSLTPALRPGHVVAIYLDGRKAASGTGNRFMLKEVVRGTHTVAAAIEEGSGAVLLRSAPVTFHLRQHTRP